ncbi:Uma2 family endonuclease [Mycobacterium sp. M1]|uniref:Uma2 family endonuclease n=1 Tax=Mycolicibacter acidiphilus TaxID=2835306 RepID=A0ABS5RIT9_9MYCO|nr:Uma2 family endonuclease [Mycolicibacter acidiphilus]MBS9534185.1 Uma2 family endonuclease [Mycolicibacter acidiphilus]
MTALVEPPGRLLTVAEYAALGEDDQCRWELQEGNLVMSPSPSPRHMIASGVLRDQLKTQLPARFVVIQDIDIDLQLDRADRPGTSRRPDLVVVERSAVIRVDTEGGLLFAAETILVIEIVSPGSRRTDYMIKRAEYADAGIPYYWIVDLEPAGAVSLRACHRTGASGYVDDGGVVHTYATDAPFPLAIDLAAIGELLS